MDGKMDGWVDGLKAVLRIAYHNQKPSSYSKQHRILFLFFRTLKPNKFELSRALFETTGPTTSPPSTWEQKLVQSPTFQLMKGLSMGQGN